MEPTDAAIQRKSKPRRHWRRALRPLAWWLILVLILYTYRLHERYSAQTNIQFSVTIEGRSVPSYELKCHLDGISILSGEHVSLGWHTFTAAHSKADAFKIDFFVWYGENNLGDLALTRTRGTLIVTANPPPQAIAIRGPEFNQTFTNVSAVTSSVPTDRYVIETQYRYGAHKQEATVSDYSTNSVSFNPRLGLLQLECNQTNASFELVSSESGVLKRGNYPMFLKDVPEGSYTVLTTHGDNQKSEAFAIEAAKTNQYRAEILYGAALIESKPSGAGVWSGEKYFGITPLVLTDLPMGNRDFRLVRDDYEEVKISLNITANATNEVERTLVNKHYKNAIQQARLFLAQQDFDAAKQSALEALKHQPDDTDAVFIERQARGLTRLAEAEVFGNRGDFTQAIKAANAALAIIPEHEPAKVLLTELTRREQARLEKEQQEKLAQAERERKQREAELAVKQRQDRLKRLTEIYDAANRAYQNAPQFANHELTSTNSASEIGAALGRGFTQVQPAFSVLSYEWPATNVFVFKARQRVGIGYREALIVSGQLQDGETKIMFKVFESENPPDVNLLGLVRLSTSVAVTTQDPQAIKNAQERWKERILEGIKLVKARLQAAGLESGAPLLGKE